ncbi:PilT protein domain protein [Cellulomonas flavigena DSM 20109]|uniref:PilT protein domain protein n=1 Tax=Cellulomonas flavigena (strain ATCC 482 / DSM 20109 / BCRC 11376 / JCM 18109 / NBRC 3775 / NCIMB 8073 / NRS 134) TaxID=446466 RepID=D5UBJ4_CELFN|nr:type II toxin-antitoxin system VapC family toxin [Cellulomonas flavigena]ADG74089.1 PilT protein domain protein [Cellulomonas flavigena DSM 20109]
MGVRPYLLDTHVLLWLLGEPLRVPTSVRDVLADPGAEILVSAVSALEVATKHRLGKLEASDLIDSWQHRLADLVATELPITGEHALLAGRLAWEHRDPFDRLLVAQAVVENAILVTQDSAIVQFDRAPVLRW